MAASLTLSGPDEKKDKVSRVVSALVDIDGRHAVSEPPVNLKVYQREKYLRQLHIFDNKKDEENRMFDEFRVSYDEF